MRIFHSFAALLLLLIASSCSPTNKNQSAEIKNEIDQYLSKAMELHHIPGLALAVLEEDKIVYENYFGKASLEDNRLVDENTLFRIYSATKLITATGIFQLVQNGALSLEDPISKYLADLPLQWQAIKIKNLLSHSSGLPNMIRYKSTLSDEELMEKLSEAEMEFVTGNQFSYNQTNYWLLAQIIEKITGMPFDEYILKNQFDEATNGVLFSSNSLENIPNRAVRYHYNGRAEVFEKATNNDGIRGHAGNGLNITLKKFIDWDKKLNSHQLLDEKTKSLMWSPFHFTNQKDHFLHGWASYPVNHVDSYGFSGGNVAAFRKFTQKNLTIILLSNSSKIPAYDIIVNDVARIVLPDLRTKDLMLEDEVMSLIVNSQFEEALQSYDQLRDENPDSDFDNLRLNINSLANAQIAQEELQKAFEFFQFNAAANPNWWISVAGLAEINEMQKDTLNAIKNYQSAIALNTNNEYNYNGLMKNKIEELKKE